MRRGSQSVGPAEEPDGCPQEGPQLHPLWLQLILHSQLTPFLVDVLDCADCPESWLLENRRRRDDSMPEDERPGRSHHGRKNRCDADPGKR